MDRKPLFKKSINLAALNLYINNNIMAQKKEIDAYRMAVLKVMMEAKKTNGEPRFDEEEAKSTLEILSDADIEFGMPFNTPQETAQMLMED